MEQRPPITINADTRLNRVLDLDEAVLDYIVSLNPHDFERLHNPMMRRFMPPRITLGRVAAMTSVPLAQLLARIAALGGVAVDPAQNEPTVPQALHMAPAWIVAPVAAEVDLLPLDDALNGDPFPPVIDAVKGLAPGDVRRMEE